MIYNIKVSIFVYKIASFKSLKMGVLPGLVTPVKDQMSCGSCAAFAATPAHETCMLKAGARMNGLDLSEQEQIDCGCDGKSMDGCNGANSGS